MIPRPSEIIRLRMVVRAAVMVLGLILALCALLPAASWVLEGVNDGDFFDLAYYAPRIIIMMSFLVAGGVLALLSRAFARLAVPMPRMLRCPACGYRLEKLAASICPECGLGLDDEFVSASWPQQAGCRRDPQPPVAAAAVARREGDSGGNPPSPAL